MKIDPIQEKVIKILADTLNLDPKKITLQSRLAEDLGVDSFSAIEIMFAIKEEFGTEIKDKDFSRIKSVEDIIKYLRRRK